MFGCLKGASPPLSQVVQHFVLVCSSYVHRVLLLVCGQHSSRLSDTCKTKAWSCMLDACPQRYAA